MSTNKTLLLQGVKTLIFTLPLLFIGPSVLYSAFKNKSHFLYIPVLGTGILLCILAVFLFFKGIKKIMNSLFDTP